VYRCLVKAYHLLRVRLQHRFVPFVDFRTYFQFILILSRQSDPSAGFDTSASRRNPSTSKYIIKGTVKDDENNAIMALSPIEEIHRRREILIDSIQVPPPNNASPNVVPSKGHPEPSQNPPAIRPPSVRHNSPPSRPASQSSLRNGQYAQEHQSEGSTGNSGIAAPTSFKMPRSGLQKPNDIPRTTNAPSDVVTISIPDLPEKLPQGTTIRQPSVQGHSSPPLREVRSSRYTRSGIAGPGGGGQMPPDSNDNPYTTNASSEVVPIVIPDPPKTWENVESARLSSFSVRGRSSPSSQPSQSSFTHGQHNQEHQSPDARIPRNGQQKPPGSGDIRPRPSVVFPIPTDPFEKLPQGTAVGGHSRPPSPPPVEKIYNSTRDTSSKQDTTAIPNPARVVQPNPPPIGRVRTRESAFVRSVHQDEKSTIRNRQDVPESGVSQRVKHCE
jgi:hypothetical protein